MPTRHFQSVSVIALWGSEWAPTYLNHPIVQANPDKTVCPLGLYFDAAPFAKQDGFLALMIENLFTGGQAYFGLATEIKHVQMRMPRIVHAIHGIPLLALLFRRARKG